jgi:CBS domain-containing protein
MIAERVGIADALNEDGHLVGVLTASDPSCALRSGLPDISAERLEQTLRSTPVVISCADLGVGAPIGLPCPGDPRQPTSRIPRL